MGLPVLKQASTVLELFTILASYYHVGVHQQVSKLSTLTGYEVWHYHWSSGHHESGQWSSWVRSLVIRSLVIMSQASLFWSRPAGFETDWVANHALTYMCIFCKFLIIYTNGYCFDWPKALIRARSYARAILTLKWDAVICFSRCRNIFLSRKSTKMSFTI